MKTTRSIKVVNILSIVNYETILFELVHLIDPPCIWYKLTESRKIKFDKNNLTKTNFLLNSVIVRPYVELLDKKIVRPT